MAGNAASDNLHGLVVCHMQARVTRPRADAAIARQRRLLTEFCQSYVIHVDWWHLRLKGYVPHPTLEDRIRAGEVYALIATGWHKLQGCASWWPGGLWQLCVEHRVRKVLLAEQFDGPVQGEVHLFRQGVWQRPPRKAPGRGGSASDLQPPLPWRAN